MAKNITISPKEIEKLVLNPHFMNQNESVETTISTENTKYQTTGQKDGFIWRVNDFIEYRITEAAHASILALFSGLLLSVVK